MQLSMPPPKKPKDGPTRLETFLSDDEDTQSTNSKTVETFYTVPNYNKTYPSKNLHSTNYRKVIMQSDHLPSSTDNEDSNLSLSISNWPSSASFSHLLEDSNNPDVPQDLTMQNGPRTPRTNTGNATPTDWLLTESPPHSSANNTSSKVAQPAHVQSITSEDSNNSLLRHLTESVNNSQENNISADYVFKTIDSLPDISAGESNSSPMRIITPRLQSPSFVDTNNLSRLLSPSLFQQLTESSANITTTAGETVTNLLVPLLTSSTPHTSTANVQSSLAALIAAKPAVLPINFVKQEFSSASQEVSCSNSQPQNNISNNHQQQQSLITEELNKTLVTLISGTTPTESVNKNNLSMVVTPNTTSHGLTSNAATGSDQYILINKNILPQLSTNTITTEAIPSVSVQSVSTGLLLAGGTQQDVGCSFSTVNHCVAPINNERPAGGEASVPTVSFEELKSTSPPVDVTSSTDPRGSPTASSPPTITPATQITDNSNGIPSDRLCLICNDCGSGFHYGVWSCEGCKAFFKRSLQGNVNYICPATNNCTIDKRRRKCCPACRLDKCRSMGMTKSDKGRDRGRNRKRRSQETFKSEVVEPKPKISRDIQTPKRSGTKRSPSLVESLLRITPGAPFKTNHDNNLPDSEMHLMNSFVELLHNELIAIVNWAKAMPGYKALSVHDQSRLLETAWMELLVLQLCGRSMASESDELVFAQDLHMNMERFRVARIEKIGARLLGLTARFSQLQVTQEEIVILRSIALLNADVISVDNPDKVQTLRSELMAALVTATGATSKMGPGGQKRDPQRMGHLLLLLPHIREASTMVIVHLFHLQRRKAVHVGALLGELLEGTEARLGQCISGTIGMVDHQRCDL